MIPLQILLVLGLFSHHVSGYAGGAPPTKDICEKMIPGHGEDPQKIPSPYSVEVDKLNPKGGETVHITLKAPTGQTFLGFLVMVKKQGDVSTNVGRFNATYAPDVAQSLTCFENSRSAMTHRSNKNKTEVTVEWIAPNEDMQNLEITTTFVKNGGEYWTHLPHPEKLTITKDASLTTPAPVEGGISEPLRQLLKESYIGCEGTTGCLGLPDGCIQEFLSTMNQASPKTCSVMVSFAARGERNVYNLTGRPSNDDGTSGYIALGLSDDDKMGQDSVVGCFANGGNVAVNRFYNRGQSNTKAESPTLGLLSTSARLDDGYLFCSFEQNDHSVPELNIKLRDNKYHYLLARGSSASANGLSAHAISELDNVASSDAIHITDVGIFGGKDNTRLLYQLHGSFMIVAWLLCASTGMFTARYYKLTHTDVMPFNKAFWFVFHLTCMFSTVFLTICGAVFIIIKKGGYSFKSADKINWHPILGTVLFGLAIFQVFIAFLRPHPGTSMRPVFNWVHWIVGNSAHIVGIACIFLANDLAPANLGKDEYMFIMMGAVLFHITMHLIMSFHTLWADGKMDTRSKRAVVPGPMKPNGLSTEAPGTGFRTVMLVLYFLGLAGCAAALIYYVVRPMEAVKA